MFPQQEIEQFVVRQACGRLRIGKLPLDDGRAHRVEVDARAVIAHADEQLARAMAGFQDQRGFSRLAICEALFGRFDTMVERVAQQMAERRVEHIEDVAIDLRRFADDRKAHPFAERAREVTHDARIGVGRVAERAHPALQRFVV
jgi:hypothetical protein